METPRYLLALREAYPLHPVFRHIAPTEAVLIEHPHVAETDSTRLAYSRSPRDGEDFLINGHKRQTLTSITKYLARHYPNSPADELFKLSQQSDKFELIHGVKNIVTAIESGPSSCMKSTSAWAGHRFDTDQRNLLLDWLEDPCNDEPEWEYHPYAVYDYEGWSLAVHYGTSPVDGRYALIGRALVCDESFVRSFYQAPEPTGTSYADTALEEWLKQQGISKWCGWEPGTRFKKIMHDSGPLLPYIDGDEQYVRVLANHVEICEQGDAQYKCDNTDGTGEEFNPPDESIGSCDRCGGDIFEYDDYYHERDDDGMICEYCIPAYTFVKYGDDNSMWYVPNDDVVRVGWSMYDRENLPYYIVELEDGDYAHEDDTVDIAGCFYLSGDERVVFTEEEEYHLYDDCWKDAEGGWHSKEVTMVELDGEFYTEEQAEELAKEHQFKLDLESTTVEELANVHQRQLELEAATPEASCES